jgi:hypothetical protein
MLQNTGGNNLFSVRADGINGMALVTFGLMDYEVKSLPPAAISPTMAKANSRASFSW